MKKLFSALLISSGLLFSASDFGQIATGSSTGTYVKIGNDLSELFKRYNIDLEVIETKGSKDNLDRLILSGNGTNKAYWAIVQKDAIKYYNYINQSKDIEKDIKILFPLYQEDIHIFIKKGSKASFNEKRNLKVAVSSKNSGSYITAKYIASSYGLTFDFMFTNFKKAKKLLEVDEIDMYITVTAADAKKFKNLDSLDLMAMPSNLLIDSMYNKKVISKSTYPWLSRDKNIFTCPSIIVTNVTEKNNDKAITAFIDIILANYKDLQKNGNEKWKEMNFSWFSLLKGYHPMAVDRYKELNLYKENTLK